VRHEPDFDINGTGFMAKERFRGIQFFRQVVTYSPIIEKRGIRQFTVLSSLIIGEDIFTDRYVDRYRQQFAAVPVDPRYVSGRLKPDYWTFDQAYGIRATNEMEAGVWYAVGKVNELTETMTRELSRQYHYA